ncbi:13701_t:CDS:2 [Cetraspora pellucida]|uniref:13701_t:CDS:1 n=1 Tax=Cetraspora pellucida TaxID=1433469 RepID=A0A9N8VT47_9GLOM|nr:13701_t:CDS:2 [Cetraspora pellucida]
MAPGKILKQTSELPEAGDEIESHRSDVCRSHMFVETLKNLCARLNLSTEGNKADLIERLTCVDDLTQPPLDLLSGSEENIGSGVFVGTHCEEENQKDSLFEETPFFDTSPRPVVEESHVKKTKKVEKESKDVTVMKALLREIKYLREDVNMISERVEASNMRAEIHKNWPEVKFERSRDQFEYNALCVIGHDLDLALSASSGEEAIQHIENARAKTLDRIVVLNVARKYGWKVAVELPQSKHEGLSAYGETIEQARQAASIKQGKRKYVNDRQFFRGKREK